MTETLSRLLLAVVVSVSILQTPIPMAHAHSGLENRGLLWVHLLRQHCDDVCDRNDLSDDDVHWHLCLPGQTDDSEEGDQDQPPAPCSSDRHSEVTLDLDWEPQGSDWLPADLLKGEPAVTPGVMAVRPSLAGPYALAPSKRTCALLCVIRC